MLSLAKRVAKRSEETCRKRGSQDQRSSTESSRTEERSCEESTDANGDSPLQPQGRLNLSPTDGVVRLRRADSESGKSLLLAEAVAATSTKRRVVSPPLEIDISDCSARQELVRLDESITAAAHRSWDELDADQAAQRPRSLEYDQVTVEAILLAAKNSSQGFTSLYIQWNEKTAQMELHPLVQATSFSNYLEHFADTGTLIRRLLLAVSYIREFAPVIEKRTIIATASAIEMEVSRLQNKNASFLRANRLIELVAVCNKRRWEAQTLAELIGCDGSRGKLNRIPTATDLMQRIFLCARDLDSEMLWRIIRTSMAPWVDQLNFVVGLKDASRVRMASFSMKLEFFPEIFLNFAEETASVILIEDQVPAFLTLRAARSVLHCYAMLCHLGRRGPEAAKRAGLTALRPLSYQGMVTEFHDLSRRGPTRLSDDFHGLDSLGQTRTDIPRPPPPPMTAGHRVRRLVRTIQIRSQELDHQVKLEYADRLLELRNVIVNVFFMRDGALWALIADPVKALFKNWDTGYHCYMTEITELVYSRHQVEVTIDPAHWGQLIVRYAPADVLTLFGSGLIAKCQAILTKLLHLLWMDRSDDMALFGTELDAAASRIDAALESDTGIAELKQAFDQIPVL